MDTDFCVFTGRLGSKPELFKTKSGKKGVNVSLAVDKSYPGKDGRFVEKVIWKQLVFWQEKAERIIKDGYKGAKVFVECSSDENRWTDRNNNKRKSDIYIVKRCEVLITQQDLNKAIDKTIDQMVEEELYKEDPGMFDNLSDHQIPE